MRKKFLLIGNGKMGSSFVYPLRNLFDFTIVDPNTTPDFPCNHLHCIQDLRGNFDYVTFAVKPFTIREVLEELNLDLFHKNTTYLSVIAGANREFYERMLGPQSKIALCMPNLPVRVGKGVVAVYSDHKIGFLDELGQIVYVQNEDEISRHLFGF